MSASTDTGIPAYENLKERFEVLINLDEANQILGKDAETVMAEGSTDDRVKKQTILSRLVHEKLVAPEVEEWLNKAENKANDLSAVDRRNLGLMRRRWIHEAGLPDELANKVAYLRSRGERLHTKHYRGGQEAWNSVMKDWYIEVFDVMRDVARAKQDRLGTNTPYEALMDVYMPGVSAASVEAEFNRLEAALKPMIEQALEKQDREDKPAPLKGPFPAEKQAELCRRVVEAVGFDTDRGRFDVIKGHPSMSGSREDVRITARVNEDNFINAVFTAAHEAGHGNYVQGYPEEWKYQPVGQHLGLHVHESQSMSLDLQACRTPEFFQYLETLARDIFKRPDDPALAAENMRRLAIRAKPSFIRVEADEMTYPLHIILRFRLGRALINGDMEVTDLPDAWAAGMKEMLGITPSSPSEGHMQDVHWPAGLQGYFPAYALGAMMAAQMFATAVSEDTRVKTDIKDGDFSRWRGWLRTRVHRCGSIKTAEEMLLDATGESLSADYLLDHLSRTFLGKSYEDRPAEEKSSAP